MPHSTSSSMAGVDDRSGVDEARQQVRTDERCNAVGGPCPQEETEAGLRRQASLPDLQGRLIKAGLFEEYLQYRANYLSWRRGGATGATGELAELGTDRRSVALIHQHEDLVGTPQKFGFFFTVSYWNAICSTAGALVLAVTNIGPLFAWYHRLDSYMMSWVALGGDLTFTLGAYLGYFQLINIPHSGRYHFVFLEWSVARSRLAAESAIGIVAYLLGMLVWDIAAVADVLPWELKGAAKWIFVRIPNLIGATCFLVGGVCEVLHNRHKTPAFVEWWTACLDFLGCVAFFVGVICGFIPITGQASQMGFAIGISCFVITGILFIVMWRSNDFGFALIGQLNDALRAGGHITLTSSTNGNVTIRHGTEVQAPQTRQQQSEANSEVSVGERGRLSVRGVVFLSLYCWLLACTGINLVVSSFRAEGWSRHAMDIVNCWLWMLIVLLVLLIHSAVTHVPNQQPYRFAMISMRVVLLGATLAQTMCLRQWLSEMAAVTDLP